MGISIVLVSLGSMGGIGLILSLLLVVADRRLAVKEDKKFTEALEILPGLNCGACGYPQCSTYLSAILEDNISIGKCRPGGAEVAENLARFLGIEGTDPESPQVARVFCSGGLVETVKDKIYSGVKSCAAAHLVGGEKVCLYSCLEFGDCVEACPFDAIHMNENALPVVDLAKCTGCGKCVIACPRNIIALTDYGEGVHVYCISHDKGALVRKICTAGCIACKICEKDDTTGAVKVDDNLAIVDHTVSKSPRQSVRRCPTEVIRVSDPVPGYEQVLEESVSAGQKKKIAST